MNVVLKKEANLKIDMENLINECVNRIDWVKCRRERGRYAPDYEDLEEVVQISLEYLYDIDFNFYDNSKQIIMTITDKLLVWCLKNDYYQEYHTLTTFFHKEEEEEEKDYAEEWRKFCESVFIK